jgi:hypothetical protein
MVRLTPKCNGSDGHGDRNSDSQLQLKNTTHPSNLKPSGQIITMQGHPELDRNMTAFLMGLRLKTEDISEEQVREAWKRVDGVDGVGGADEERAGWATLEFFLQDSDMVLA